MSAVAVDRIESEASAASTLVDGEHPWLGLDSFSEETRQYFYGREEEVAELARRVQRKTLAILFGQSGLGKTSILRAGIVPRLRREGFCPVYVRVDYSRDSPAPSQQIKQAVFRATEALGRWTKPGSSVPGESLWEFLHHRDDVLLDAMGKPLTPLLIFDQFEEIFTLAQDDDFGRQRAAEFLEDLADLVENRPPRQLEVMLDKEESIVERFDFNRADYRVLIALREDYLAHLEGLKDAMPSITQNRMRLARMTGHQALAAVVKPGGRLVPEEVAESIVRYVAGGAELRNAEVEPSLLSLVCRELNNARIAQGRAEISADLLAGSRETILVEFYERALGDQPAGVRRFIEDEMLTESGFRESLAEERVVKGFAAADALPTALPLLVNRRLLRIEERLDARRVELTHDVLCPVVKASRDARHEREAREEMERHLAEERASKESARKALVRARWVAGVCGVLAIGAVAGAFFGWFNMQRAQSAEAEAQRTRALAESARGEAEKLIVYLLEDFQLELEPVGRLDIVANLSKRALDYYAALPPELRTTDSERNRALALVRYGYALRNMAKLDDADKSLAEAVAVLQRLRESGDKAENTLVGLGLGLTGLARVRGSQNRGTEEVKLAAEGEAAMRPLMDRGLASTRVLRAYGQVTNYLGFSQFRQARLPEAIATLKASREAFRSIDGLTADTRAAAGYTESSGWLADALMNANQRDEARKVGEEGVAIATRILDERPGDMSALRGRAVLLAILADSEAYRQHHAAAIPYVTRAVLDWETFVKIDPNNAIGWNNLMSAKTRLAGAFDELGRVSEYFETARAGLSVERNLKQAPALVGNLVPLAAWIAIREAELGNRAASEAARAEHRRLSGIAMSSLPPSSIRRQLGTNGLGRFDAWIAVSAGNYAEASEKARATVQALEQINATASGELRFRDILLGGTYHAWAEAAYALGRYADAEKAVRAAIPIRERVGPATIDGPLAINDNRVLLALVLARQGRDAEARTILEPELALQRRLLQEGSDDVTQFSILARALLAQSLVAPAQARALLREALAALDRIPAQAAKRRYFATLRAEIAAEAAKR